MNKESFSLIDVINDQETQDQLVGLLSDEDESPPKPAEKGADDSVQSDEGDADSSQSQGDDASDAAEAEEDTDEADTAADETYEVPVDGETVAVTFDELKKGYSRTADYTRKTQKLAEDRRELETRQQAAVAEAEAMRVSRQRYDSQLEALEGVLKQAQPVEPDPALARENPAEYAAQEALYNRHQRQVEAVTQERRRVAEDAQKQQQAEITKVAQLERVKLLKAIPEWGDEAKRAPDQRALVEYAGQLGFTPEVLAATVDHRLFVILRKAMLYDRVTAKTPAPKKGAKTPTVRPGAGVPRKPTTKQDAARQRLGKTGSAKDAAAVLEGLLDD